MTSESDQIQKVTVKESAEWCDLSLPRFHELKREGVFEATPGRGKRDLKSDIRSYVRWLRRNSVGKNRESGSYEEERIRKTSAEADKTELEVEILRGRLIEAAEVGQMFGMAGAVLRASLESIPTKAAAIAVAMSESEIEGMLAGYIEDALNEFSSTDLRSIRKSPDRDDARAEVDGKPVGGQGKAIKSGGKRGAGPVEH